MHASSVDLILNLQTGLSSLQFHIQFYSFFEKVRTSGGNLPKFSQWQLISWLKTVKVKRVILSEL